MGLYLPDGCKLFDDEEVADKEIVGEKMLFMDENPPPLNTFAGIFIYELAWHFTWDIFWFIFSVINDLYFQIIYLYFFGLVIIT